MPLKVKGPVTMNHLVHTDLEIWPTSPLIFTQGVNKCKIWPFKRCGFETKQRYFSIWSTHGVGESINFWTSSASGSWSRNFLKDSSTLRDRAFFCNLAHVSGQTDRILMQILPLRTRKSPINFWSQQDPTPDPDQIRLGRGLRSPSSLVNCYTLCLKKGVPNL